MLLLICGASAAHAQDAQQRLFERVFGDAVKLDPAMVEKVRAAKPGERILIDRNGDGENDEAWYIDTAARHTKQVKPLLVRAIDEDGDLDEYLGPDLDSDLYVADFNADGTVDAVLDYQDDDGDGDVDEMAFYFYMKHHAYFGDDVLRVWWSRDDGDDNLLWYDVDYTYYQDLCQYRCHFSGDESFVAFGLTPGKDQWVSAFENPFLFYDPDGDRCSEVVLRIEGHDDEVRAIRYSFDADDDAFGDRTHDYDFSITARAAKDDPVRLPGQLVKGMTLRGIPTQGWLRREHACKFVEDAPWAVAVLTWDEINANTEQNVEKDPHERWEGVIAHSSEHFEQVGGPPCSPLNKRNEISLKPVAPMKLYYDPTDHRLHLKGANEGWLHVDFDFDGQVDAKYTYIDEDKDGFFDRRQLDLDADGTVDFDWPMAKGPVQEFELDFKRLSSFYKPVLQATLQDSQIFIDVAKVAPGQEKKEAYLQTFFLTRLESWLGGMGAKQLGRRIRESPGGARFYVDLLRDRLCLALKRNFGTHARWGDIEKRYAAGDYRGAGEIVAAELASSVATRPSAFQDYSQRLAIRIDNTGRPQRVDWPVVISLQEIKAVAEDFLPTDVVVAPQRWIDWRQVPGQIDQLHLPTGKPESIALDADEGEISFLVDVPADGSATYYLYWTPTGFASRSFPDQTGTAEDWVPPNIGWESNRGAYRAYWGQFDFFGKKTDRLIYHDIGATSYHEETDWGIDALHVGETSGLGGLTLYQGDRAYPIQNPAGKGEVEFTKRVLTHGPVRAVIEITAANIVPDKPDLAVRMHCLVYAERRETEIRVRVTGADGDVVLAPGIVKLPREKWFADPQAGCFGSWGFQQDVIGEIGMGLIVSPGAIVGVLDLPGERRVKCRAAGGELRYWLIGDWRRGRQHPVAPTIDNWGTELHELAGLLLHDVKVEINTPEDVR